MKASFLIRAAVLLPGLALCLALVFGPDELLRARDVTAWRERASPWDYLEQYPWGLYRRKALADIDALQRPLGLVSRLQPPPSQMRSRAVADQVQSAAFDPEEQQIVTGAGTAAVRWDIASGTVLDEIFPAHRRDIEDGQTWGRGFVEVAWTDGGRVVAGLTGSPHTLWFMRNGQPQGRVRLGGQSVEQLSARDGRLAWMQALMHGTVLPAPGGEPYLLPHADVTAVALADGGRAVTASRSHLQWWQGAAKGRSIPIAAKGNPVALSADALWALAPSGRQLELWSTPDGRRVAIELASEVRAVCATGTHLAAGRADGHVQLWSLAGMEPLREFRSSAGAISRLVCGQQHLLAVGDHDTDARIWRLDGQAQAGPVPEPPAPRFSWLVLQAADGQWARRWPGLVGWLEEASGSPLQGIAVGLMALIVVVVQVIGRRAGRAQ